MKLYRIDRNRFRLGQFVIELHFFSGEFRLSLGFAEHDCAVTASLCLWVFSFYIQWDNWRVRRVLEPLTKRPDQRYTNGREMNLYWFENGLWWSLWHDPMESRSGDPWYVKMHVIRPLDVLFGYPRYSSRTLRTERTIVPMPEGGYPATVTVNEDSWKRPRWPKAKTVVRCEVKPDTAIPFPGKGENAWDCGDDASHSLYGPYPDAFAATMAMATSVMRSRVRYGSWDYKPGD